MNRILTKGDEAVLSLALQEKAKEIMANDDGLGKIAMALGFNVKATPDLLMEGLRENLLSLQDFEVFMMGVGNRKQVEICHCRALYRGGEKKC